MQRIPPSLVLDAELPEEASAAKALLSQQKQPLLVGTEAPAIMSVAETALSWAAASPSRVGPEHCGPAQWGRCCALPSTRPAVQGTHTRCQERRKTGQPQNRKMCSTSLGELECNWKMEHAHIKHLQDDHKFCTYNLTEFKGGWILVTAEYSKILTHNNGLWQI